MTKKISICLLLCFALPLIGKESTASQPLPSSSTSENVVANAVSTQAKLFQKSRGLRINNRPLAKINGKVISLIDVVKQMDLDLFRFYPDITPSPIERYQYYLSRWQPKLTQMIESELILLDVENKEIKITAGQVREALANQFGPNVMANLAKVNLSYDEALDLLETELKIRELTGIYVQAKAMQTVTPSLVWNAYEQYVAANPPEQICTYQVLSIRPKSAAAHALPRGLKVSEENAKGCPKTSSEELVNQLQTKLPPLLAKAANLSKLANTLTLHPTDPLAKDLDQNFTISVSTEFSTEVSKISTEHLQVLEPLAKGEFSPPVTQISRSTNLPVIRVFHLKDRTEKRPESFLTIQDKIKDELFYQECEKEKALYVQKLKKKFSYDYYDPTFVLPADYQPFLLS